MSSSESSLSPPLLPSLTRQSAVACALPHRLASRSSAGPVSSLACCACRAFALDCACILVWPPLHFPCRLSAW
eukprot:678739-Alexandrium_andersonii.AAC.1